MVLVLLWGILIVLFNILLVLYLFYLEFLGIKEQVEVFFKMLYEYGVYLLIVLVVVYVVVVMKYYFIVCDDMFKCMVFIVLVCKNI